MTADEIIKELNMQSHPEGGHFVETFRDDACLPGSNRAVSTAIYYLLQAGEFSHWHRVDAVEVWHYHAGAPLKLSLSADGNHSEDQILGTDILNGQRPQILIPLHQWQRAESLGDWTLVGCTVAPGFEFSGFEMAEKGWSPGG
jgi:predicted cupin superfamily sugar epimerase